MAYISNHRRQIKKATIVTRLHDGFWLTVVGLKNNYVILQPAGDSKSICVDKSRLWLDTESMEWFLTS